MMNHRGTEFTEAFDLRMTNHCLMTDDEQRFRIEQVDWYGEMLPEGPARFCPIVVSRSGKKESPLCALCVSVVNHLRIHPAPDLGLEFGTYWVFAGLGSEPFSLLNTDT